MEVDLARLRELANRTAWRRRNSEWDFQDAAQEAWIKGWQTATAHPSKPESYVQRAISNRLVELATGSRPLGSERPVGGDRRGPKIVTKKPLALYGLPEDFHPAATPREVGVPLWVREMLPDPLDRKIVSAVIYGQELKSLSLALGKGKGWATQRWHNSIQPRLKEAWENANSV